MTQPDPRPLEVLLVEDSKGDALITAEAFEEADIAVNLVVAEDGPEALRYLGDATSISGRRVPDLIVLDINLPGMSGLDVLDEIRRHRLHSRIPVLVLSGSSAPADIRASHRGHAFRFVSKPIEVAELVEAVRALESHWMPTQTRRRALATLFVLLVEADDAAARRIGELLSDAPPPPFDPIVLQRARTRLEMMRILQGPNRPDCVLLDPGISDARGAEAVLEATATAPHVPIILLSNSDDPDLAREALAAGAQDHLVTGPALTEEVVRRSIRYAIDRTTQVSALRASRQELSEFAHRIALDLKAPMAVLVSLLGVLRQRKGDPADIALHERASQASVRLVEMVDGLLEYAERAGSEEALGPVDLGAVVDWVRAAVADDLATSALEVRGSLPSVHANEIGLRQVLLSLVTNSIKYRRRDTPVEIVVTGRRSGDLVVIEVRDNGRGIDPEYRHRVFEAGFRVLVDQPGTGMGLATALRIMQLVGGKISVADGENGAGTTMRLEFFTQRHDD